MKKSAFTLLEIMIVIVLIGIIGTVVGVNVRGSLNEGKKFKTEQCAHQIEDILTMMAGRPPLENLGDSTNFAKKDDRLIEALQASGLVKDPLKVLTDGWGDDFVVSYQEGKFTVKSTHYDGSQCIDPKKKKR